MPSDARRHFAAICPHSGGLPAEEFEEDAATLYAAFQAFWRCCVGSRYVGRIYERIDGKWVEVWREGQEFREVLHANE